MATKRLSLANPNQSNDDRVPDQIQRDLTQTGPIPDLDLTQTGHSGDTISILGQVKVKSGSGQGPVSSIWSGSGQGPVSSIDSENITLAPQQQRVYEWFLHNGFTGFFNKGIISRETQISPPTVRKSISKLKNLSLIKIHQYDPVSRQQKYQLNTQKAVELLPVSGQGQVSSQGQVSGQGQVKSGSPLYKKERKILNNLSFYLTNSDFWKKSGLSIQKCQSWIDELSFCDPEMLLQQLQYAEFLDNVKTADNPISYFYGTLKKGCFTRPTGFESPEEKAHRLRKNELEIRQKALASLEELRKQEQELADKEAFYAFLADNESVAAAVKDIGNQFVTHKFKASLKVYHDAGKIDSRLEKRLEQYFLVD